MIGSNFLVFVRFVTFHSTVLRSRSRLCKAVPAASFWQAKQESLVLVSNIKHDLRAVCKGKSDQKKNCINDQLLRAQNDKLQCMVLDPLFLPGAGADPIWSEPESAFGLPEP